MNPVSYTVTGTGTGVPVLMDYRQNPFSVGLGCVVVGVVTYSVQHTFDSPVIIASGSATWFNNANITAASANQNTNYAFPVTAIRLNNTAATGTANVTMTLIQASNSP